MKFRVTSQLKAKAVPKSLAPSLLDDPAFSADPCSHPYFVTSHEPEWTTSPPVGHPPLKKPRRPRILVTDENLTDTEFPLIQPPNSPAPPSSGPTAPPSLPVPPDVHRQVPALEHTHPPAASTAPSSLPTRAHPAVLSTPPDPALKTPKHEKKNNLMTFLTRRKTAPTQATPPAAMPKSKKLQARRSVVPDLPHDVTRPPASRQASEPIKPPTQERPVLPARPATIGAATPISVSTATSSAGSSGSKRLAAGVNSRLQDLDKIDELDETNPLGISLHHKGPYDAAVQAIKLNGKGGPLAFANGSASDSHLRAMQANGRAYVPPQAPAGVSLNLLPGQILPRNFHIQYNQPGDRSEPQIRPLIAQQAESSLRNAYQQAQPSALMPLTPFSNPPPKMRVEVYDDRGRPAPALEKPVEDDALNSFDIGMAMLQPDLLDDLPTPRVFVEPGLPVEDTDFNPYDPVHLQHPRTPSPAVPPPGKSREASRESSRAQSRAPSRAPSPEPTLGEESEPTIQPETPGVHKEPSSFHQGLPPPYSSPIHESFAPQAQPRHSPSQSRAPSRNPSPPRSRKSDETARSLDVNYSRPTQEKVNIAPTQDPMAPSQLPSTSSMHVSQQSREQVQIPPSLHTSERETRSTHQSVSTGSSGQTRGGRPPSHRHLPKRLVMPAPLNNNGFGPVPNQIRSPPVTVSYLPPMTAYLPPNQVQGPFRPQPHAYPALMMTAPRPVPQVPPPPPQAPVRAQEIPVASSRKLKKRASMVNTPKPAPPPPPTLPTQPVVTTVSFAPPIIEFDHSLSRDKILARSQTEKISSKRLSKRRGNV